MHNLCQILDNALEKMPKCKDFELYRACVHEDRSDFAVGDIFEPQYVITTSADSTWQNHDANRFVINPLPPNLTKARSIYHIYNKANEYQVTFLSNAKFVVSLISNWGNGKQIIYMDEIE